VTHVLIRAIRDRLRRAGNPVRAAGMQRYLKSEMPCRGVSMPHQRAIWGELFREHPLSSARQWQGVAFELWRRADCREERYAAIALTDWKPYAPYLTYDVVPMVEEMIVTGAWWDYVDWLASHQLGAILARERAARRGARMGALMKRWAKGDDLWKRRAAILCQLRFRSETDLDLLYACLEPNLLNREPARGSQPPDQLQNDFFIRKAVGWALRQYAWSDPDEVRRYAAAQRKRLSPLSIREALKNIGSS
jgi:3-methyladenine DNA glycosylase AlkD